MKRFAPIYAAILIVAVCIAYMVGKHNGTENVSPTSKGTVEAFNDGWLDGNRDLADQLAKLVEGGCTNPQVELRENAPAEVVCPSR